MDERIGFSWRTERTSSFFSVDMQAITVHRYESECVGDSPVRIGWTVLGEVPWLFLQRRIKVLQLMRPLHCKVLVGATVPTHGTRPLWECLLTFRSLISCSRRLLRAPDCGPRRCTPVLSRSVSRYEPFCRTMWRRFVNALNHRKSPLAHRQPCAAAHSISGAHDSDVTCRSVRAVPSVSRMAVSMVRSTSTH